MLLLNYELRVYSNGELSDAEAESAIADAEPKVQRLVERLERDLRLKVTLTEV